jgi:hypothetical protein
MASRPERVAPPEIFYDDTEARKYTSSSRIIDIQVLFSFLLLFPFSFFFKFNSILILFHINNNHRPHYQNVHLNYSLYLKMMFPNYSLILVHYISIHSFHSFYIHFVMSELYIFCLGCGSGLSGETLSEEGHQWIGLDISPSMLSMFSFFSIF